MMDKIKIGQIGVCHEHAGGKIAGLRKLSELFEIVGVVDDRASSTTPRFVKDELGLYEGLRFMTERELLDTPGLRAVTVETPNLELVPTALRCMERGLAIHMDKPGGDEIEQFARLRNGCEARGLTFQMGYMFRSNPAIQWCARAVRQGWLGDVFEIQASMSHDYGGEDYQAYIGEFPGGIMFNLGCHLIDMVVAMLGSPKRVTPFLKSAPGYPDSVKNNCLTVLEYPHATVALRACSKEVDGIARRRLKICGTKGAVELCPLERFDGEPLRMRLTLSEGNDDFDAGTRMVDFGVVADRYESQLRELAKTINGEMENPYTPQHDILVQKLLLAASGTTTWKE